MSQPIIDTSLVIEVKQLIQSGKQRRAFASGQHQCQTLSGQ